VRSLLGGDSTDPSSHVGFGFTASTAWQWVRRLTG
jgi:hypothetical protein